MPSPQFLRAIAERDLAIGTKQRVDLAGREVLLCNDAGTIHAVSNLCSHAEEKLECGLMRYGWIACPAHGARFDLETGVPMNPPATAAIAVYPVRVSDGWIEVAV